MPDVVPEHPGSKSHGLLTNHGWLHDISCRYPPPGMVDPPSPGGILGIWWPKTPQKGGILGFWGILPSPKGGVNPGDPPKSGNSRFTFRGVCYLTRADGSNLNAPFRFLNSL